MAEQSELKESIATGCGCAILAGIGLLAAAVMFGCIMGDYIGPPEGAAQDARDKGVTMLVALGVIGVCGITGIRMINNRKS